ncbi:RnfABCDGE type electron transport complex subunit B [Aquabacterium sp. J223]|uniref:RnfABCDGE type electron transport complex subunit B n=1 Tax=Aquabacterium sp. J223 TaxID=2898431 RepID=UPI0021ADE03D|nr:RnfABCDGE type electron transport complex subunit B [Aquabacterium sp. J223]UUX97641.1 RnfABCDGE type electron transport complex subunit B [Aquabacterium sp. J223]
MPPPLADSLADALDASLPQTQCTRCGYPDCRRYAEAMAHGSAAINRCPPGGAEGVARLAALTGRSVLPLDPDCGDEGPLRVARIAEADCIGCTLCLDACPVDAIVGAPKRMHQVVAAHCTGCALCLPPCPVDCIRLDTTEPARTGWAAWQPWQAEQARQRYRAHQARREGIAGMAATAGDAPPDAATPADAASGVPTVTPSPAPAGGADHRPQRLLAQALANARARRTQAV